MGADVIFLTIWLTGWISTIIGALVYSIKFEGKDRIILSDFYFTLLFFAIWPMVAIGGLIHLCDKYKDFSIIKLPTKTPDEDDTDDFNERIGT
jgi:hypothetical protein